MTPPSGASDASPHSGPAEAPRAFGERVRERRRRLRTEAGRRWTQGDLARALGVERNTVSRWENGGARPRDPAIFAALARVLRVSPDWLAGGRSSATATAAGRQQTYEHPSGGDLWAGPRGADSPRTETSAPAELLDLLPRDARELARGYLGRLAAAGATANQLEAAARILVGGGTHALTRTRFDQRTPDEIAADVDAAWDFITRVLRRDGLRP